MRANALLYDCEIKKAIHGKSELRLEGIDYCEGWGDFAGMGISCIGAYDFTNGRTRLFMDDNYDEFQRLVADRELIIGFNNRRFDDKLCAANGITIPDEKAYDMLQELWRAANLSDSTYSSATHANFGLDRTCRVNLGLAKSGTGALAPILYQRRQLGQLVDYCLNDIFLEVELLELIVQNRGKLIDPRSGTGALRLALPRGFLPL